MNPAVEDEFNDILSKAQKGLGLSTETLAERTGVAEARIRGLRRGEFDAEAAAALTGALGLRTEPLLAIGEGWSPKPTPEPDGFRRFTTEFGEGSVNAYLAWDRRSGQAVAFDTGMDASGMLSFIEQRGLKLTALLLTHAHRDHVADVESVRSKTGAQVYLNSMERFRGETLPVTADFSLEAGALKITALQTPGHSAGGVTFVVAGLARPVAVVGDALFAGSMGGAMCSYSQSLRSLGQILSHPPETLLAPGHGPLTTVEIERRMNCFWSPAIGG